MKHILVPFDGSKSAKRALEHAIRLAAPRRTGIHLLNVEPELDDYGMVRAYLTASKHRKMTEARARAILGPAERRLKAARVQYESHVSHGEPAVAIATMARRLRCGSIVMGTRGMGPIANVVLGSVASKTIHLSPVPVTLVR